MTLRHTNDMEPNETIYEALTKIVGAYNNIIRLPASR